MNVNPNPARFDVKKAEAINGEHVRRLAADDFAARLVAPLQRGGVLPDEPTPAQLALLRTAAPLVQERLQLLGEAPGLLGFLFTDAEALGYESEALATLKDDAARVLQASFTALTALPDGQWGVAQVEAALREALIDGLGLKPRLAFGPLRVAVSGRRVSPPLFESIELLGREETLARLQRLLRERAA